MSEENEIPIEETTISEEVVEEQEHIEETISDEPAPIEEAEHEPVQEDEEVTEHPVAVLYIMNFAEKDRNFLTKYFSDFGKVLNIDFKVRNDGIPYCFVHLKPDDDPELIYGEHSVEDRFFEVKPYVRSSGPSSVHVSYERAPSETDLMEAFSVFGEVSFIYLSRNFARVRFDTREPAEEAIRLGKVTINGEVMGVKPWHGFKEEDRVQTHQTYPVLPNSSSNASPFVYNQPQQPIAQEVPPPPMDMPMEVRMAYQTYMNWYSYAQRPHHVQPQPQHHHHHHQQPQYNRYSQPQHHHHHAAPQHATYQPVMPVQAPVHQWGGYPKTWGNDYHR
ncbi:hypothetical protein PCE1_004816 [Barthelona sp. PCE]